jgi:hypothetical protein
LPSLSWVGNYQEDLCTVRKGNRYFHIDPNGRTIYSEQYIYAGDFKEGCACVKQENGFFRHIDYKGRFLNGKEFEDLGVFHKKFATAKDKYGWHHIDKNGNEIYNQRYLAIEPFYNGYALVTHFDNQKQIINERGDVVLEI